MAKTSRKYAVKQDLKQLGYDFLHIYPRTLSWIINNWKFTLIFIVVLWSTFYLDGALRYYMLLIKNPALEPVMRFGWWYGNGNPTLYLFIIFYLIGNTLQNHKLRQTGALIFESYIYSGIVTLVFKSTFGRYRPYTNIGDLDFEWFIIGSNDVYSFSSGHSSVAFALSTVLASLTTNRYIKTLFYLLAALTAISRMYHDQHWLSDVSMGAFIGTLITVLLIRMHKEEQTELIEPKILKGVISEESVEGKS